MKPSAAMTWSAGTTVLLAVARRVTFGSTGRRRRARRPAVSVWIRVGPHSRDVEGGGVAAERPAAVHEGDRPRDRLQRVRPVQRAVAAADDETSWSACTAGSRTKYDRPVPSHSSPHSSGRGVEVPMPEVRTTARAWTTVPSSSVTAPAVGDASRSTAWRPSRYVGSNASACSTRAATKSRPRTAGIGGHVADLLLRVERHHLAARLRQDVDDDGAQPAEARVVGAVEAGRSRRRR